MHICDIKVLKFHYLPANGALHWYAYRWCTSLIFIVIWILPMSIICLLMLISFIFFLFGCFWELFHPKVILTHSNTSSYLCYFYFYVLLLLYVAFLSKILTIILNTSTDYLKVKIFFNHGFQKSYNPIIKPTSKGRNVINLWYNAY